LTFRNIWSLNCTPNKEEIDAHEVEKFTNA
jgi:hypothetical protein